jgi:hypothetical protein
MRVNSNVKERKLTNRAALPVAFLALGAVTGGVGGWYAAREYYGREWLGAVYYRAAMEGRSQVHMLEYLRRSDIAGSIAMLEALVDGNLFLVEKAKQRDMPIDKVEAIDGAASEMRAYRARYPRNVTSSNTGNGTESKGIR